MSRNCYTICTSVMMAPWVAIFRAVQHPSRPGALARVAEGAVDPRPLPACLCQVRAQQPALCCVLPRVRAVGRVPRPRPLPQAGSSDQLWMGPWDPGPGLFSALVCDTRRCPQKPQFSPLVSMTPLSPVTTPKALQHFQMSQGDGMAPSWDPGLLCDPPPPNSLTV